MKGLKAIIIAREDDQCQDSEWGSGQKGLVDLEKRSYPKRGKKSRPLNLIG